jgi:hypothetical protein
MATVIDILVPQISIKTKRWEVDLTPLKEISQRVYFQGASQCGVSCPICQNERASGACGLNAGHTGNHVCNRVSTHTWITKETPDIPGPR